MIDSGKALRSEWQRAMKDRTKQFAKNVVLACRQVAASPEGRHLASQLFRAGTSVAANYRTACRARSKKEFISRIGIVLEEADESLFWLEISRDLGILEGDEATTLCDEANQLVAIFIVTQNTARQGMLSRQPISKSGNS